MPYVQSNLIEQPITGHPYMGMSVGEPIRPVQLINGVHGQVPYMGVDPTPLQPPPPSAQHLGYPSDQRNIAPSPYQQHTPLSNNEFLNGPTSQSAHNLWPQRPFQNTDAFGSAGSFGPSNANMVNAQQQHPLSKPQMGYSLADQMAAMSLAKPNPPTVSDRPFSYEPTNAVLPPPPISTLPEQERAFAPISLLPPIGAPLHGSSAVPTPGFVPSIQPGIQRAALPQPQHKISPEQLPDYIRTRDELADKYGSVYETGSLGLPPSSTLHITYKDTGNVNPRFVRSTLYYIPTSSEVIKQSQLPVALMITPLAQTGPSEDPVMLTKFEGTLPVRCNRCKAYMSPQARFTDGGNRFQCVLCETHTQVPQEYFAHVDYTGRRVDANSRPELCMSSYDIVATVEYCEKGVFPKPAKFIFVVDVTYASVKCGLTRLICEKLQFEVLEYLPRDPYSSDDSPSPIEIGLITFDSRLHFYNFSSIDNPEVFIVPDVSDPFIPLLHGFFVGADKLGDSFDRYLQNVSAMFADTHETVVAVGPAIQAARRAFEAAECPGKIFVFLTTMPTDPNIPGRLVNKDEQNLLGTDKEKNALAPASKYYTELGNECVSSGCAVDLFVFASQFIDMASLAEVSRVSGGQVFYYRYFNVQTDSDRFLADLRYTVYRPTVFNAVMRVRSSNGIRATDFIGSFKMQNVTDMEFGALDCDKTICVEFSYDDKIADGVPIHFQIALLHTTISGRRLVRVHNCHIPSTSSLLDLYQNTNFEAIISYIIKIAGRSLLMSSINQIRSNVITQLAAILSCYRSQSPSALNSSLLLLPEALKMIPLFVNSILKCDAIGGVQSVTPDQKSWLLSRVEAMGCDQIIPMVYPSLHMINFVEESQDNPQNLKPEFREMRCMYESLDPFKIYLLENGLTMWVWIGSKVPATIINLLFGVSTFTDIKSVEMHEMPALNNHLSEAVLNFIADIRFLRKHMMRVNVVKQGHSLETFFRNYLVEDSGLGGSKSYTSFLFELHGEIRQLSNQR